INAELAQKLGERIRRAIKSDHDTDNPVQPYRVAGTVNYPSAQKIARGRVLFADLIRIAQRNPEKPFTPGFECDDMLARGEHHSPKRHHAFFADRLANDRERLLADFAIGNEVIRAV